MEQLTVINQATNCHFCGRRTNNHLKFGPIYKLGKIKAHYYCVLLSNRLIQNGNDDEGILGFLLSDIQNELQRTSKILCFYCKKGNATITCAATKCKRNFHLPCGLSKGSSHQFVNQFKSFCHYHRLVQHIPAKIFKEACNTDVICCICQETVNVKSKQDSLWAPCCLKTWYHRDCVQKLAHSAGYFCRCAACNDSKKFNEWMQRYGIFIPQQDASWELVPNAFEELLYKYNNCDAKTCKCPQGRQSSKENTIWEIIVCDSCGSQGIHIACGNLKFVNPEWECTACNEITKNFTSSSTAISNKKGEGSSKLKSTEVGQKKRRRASEENYVLDKRKRRKTHVEEDEIEIDVETVDDGKKDDETLTGGVDISVDVEDSHQGDTKKLSQEADPLKVLNQIKPGPLSYKLATIRKVWGDLLLPEKLDLNTITGKSDPPSIELIELSDSEESKQEDDSDVEVVEEIKKQTPEERLQSILHYRVTKNRTVMTKQEEQTEQSDSSVQNFSLENFDVVAVLSVQTTFNPQNGLLTIEKPIETRSYVQIPAFSPPNPGPSLYTLECRPNKTVLLKEEKEIVQVIDDEVIVLKD